MVYSIGVYRDRKGALLFVPDGFDKNGIGRSLDWFEKIELPYSHKSIGKAVKETLNISRNAPVIEDVKALGNVFERATGIKGWAKFSKEHLCVSAALSDQGYRFAPLKRVRGGGYLGEVGDPVIEIGLDSSEEEIGETVVRAFSFLT
ncbi:MAG: hypothetical protein E6X17_13265 [Sporomusaceae bacterium]|nr:hypothetical protein [Sporomusaceae bacterium]